MAGEQTAIGLAYAQQISTSRTTYAGGGAWGSQGTASWTSTPGLSYIPGPIQHQMQTQPLEESYRYRTSMRIQIPQTRIYMAPAQIWSAWTSNSYDTTSDTTSTVDSTAYQFSQRVWGSWVEHEREQTQQAAYQLNQQGLEEVRRENERREQEYREAAARYEAQAEERAQAQLKEQERKKAAEDVAQILLGEIIGEDQLAVYKETGRLLVRGDKHDYLVWRTGKVQRIEKNKLVDLCVYTKERIIMPETDNVIGLAMHIKAQEKHFNEIANASRPIPRPKDLPLAANY